MKIHNEILIFVIEILSNFLELNASREPHGEGSSMARYIDRTPRPSRELRRRDRPPGRPPSPEITIIVLRKTITVPLKLENDKFVARECILDGENYHGVPNNQYREKHDYYTIAKYGMFQRQFIKCVVYVEHKEDGTQTVLGAKPPPTSESYGSPGIPRFLNPDRSTWYICYSTIDFVVTQEAINKIQVDITTLEVQNNHPDPQEIMSGAVKTFEVSIGGAYFLAFVKDKNFYGVMFPPDWWNRSYRDYVMSLPQNSQETLRTYLSRKRRRRH